ncbi:ABC transporter permease [Paraflavitalea sp. CAU 1676]|uniref:ABC transporter permease n=1 Tax=Paraflavitalea sp. CAU 1676 TaxID=3032598 RepID=UPI0023DC3859|nr:ABC transporter permease [Paraflavitalea sp. CAU 1676]MDF2187346.1 ABC transporter permease [Paraflavitalea sp. CAU 1676]
MVSSYFKIALRNIIRNKAHTFINVTGLSAGIAVAILIGLWMYDELAYDTIHNNYDRIAKIRQHITVNGEVKTDKAVPFPLATELNTHHNNYFKYVVLSSHRATHLLGTDNKQLSQHGVYLGPQAPDMLSLQMIKGTRNGLMDPSSILLSRSAAKALFGGADPVDQILQIDNQEKVKVTGVYEDLPANSTFTNVKFIAPFQLYLKNAPWVRSAEQSWDKNPVQAYVQLQEGVRMDQASLLIREMKKQRAGAEQAKYNPILFLEPMSRWRLYAEYENGVNIGGRIKYVWMFGIIGAFVLLLACINFMNLSTARSEKRAREVGVRKAIGSMRVQIIAQFYFEAMMVAALAFLGGLLLVQTLLPFFNRVAGKSIAMPWSEPIFWAAGAAVTLITGLIAGSYPALYLSSFHPVKVLKGTFRVGEWATLPRKVSVVVQFAVTIALIICTIVVIRQMEYAKSRPVGYKQELLVSLATHPGGNPHRFTLIREELVREKVITAMAGSQAPATDTWGSEVNLHWKGKDPNATIEFPVTGVSLDYGKTIGWQIVAGRDFAAGFATDSNAFIINEAAVQYMGLKDPVGQTITWGNAPCTIIGVVKNMLTESPYEQVRPSLYWRMDAHSNYVFAKLNPAMGASPALQRMEEVFRKYDPAAPFEYRFVDEDYQQKFGNEEKVSNLGAFFTALAILISCMGLFGLASFMAEQRTKEIGVRKVLGATVWSIWTLLTREFCWLVLIGLLIAVPIAWYGMHQWLQNYEYRTSITWWIVAATAAGALLLTILTVSYHAIRAALANPVRSLRTE